MVRRRPSAPLHDPQKAAERIEENQAKLLAICAQLASDLGGRLARMEKDVATGALGQVQLRTEMSEGWARMGELRDGLGKLRDQVEKNQSEQAGQVAESAAHGAAQGAMESVAQVGKSFWATWSGKTVASAVAFTALVTGAQAVPAVLRWIEKFWAFVAGAK